MQFVSEEYKDKGVVAFSIHPGNMMTDMVAEFPGGLPDIFKPGESEFYSYLCISSLVLIFWKTC